MYITSPTALVWEPNLKTWPLWDIVHSEQHYLECSSIEWHLPSTYKSVLVWILNITHNKIQTTHNIKQERIVKIALVFVFNTVIFLIIVHRKTSETMLWMRRKKSNLHKIKYAEGRKRRKQEKEKKLIRAHHWHLMWLFFKYWLEYLPNIKVSFPGFISHHCNNIQSDAVLLSALVPTQTLPKETLLNTLPHCYWVQMGTSNNLIKPDVKVIEINSINTLTFYEWTKNKLLIQETITPTFTQLKIDVNFPQGNLIV